MFDIGEMESNAPTSSPGTGYSESPQWQPETTASHSCEGVSRARCHTGPPALPSPGPEPSGRTSPRTLEQRPDPGRDSEQGKASWKYTLHGEIGVKRKLPLIGGLG